VLAHQISDALDGDVGGEGEEGDGNQAQGPAFVFLADRATQLPDHDRGSEELDHRVQAEPDQHDRGGDDPDRRLDRHPGHAGVLQPETPAAQPGYHIVMHGQSHSRITSRYACRTRAHSASSP
jgi:hypothetical protein